MTGENQKNPAVDDCETGEQVGDEFIPDNACPICPKCLKPCHPLQYYCDKCHSNDAINPLTPYIGFVNIRFNYDIFLTMWRKIWYEKHMPIIAKLLYLLLVVWFTPIVLVIGLPLLLAGIAERPHISESTRAALYIVAITIFLKLRAFLPPFWIPLTIGL